MRFAGIIFVVLMIFFSCSKKKQPTIDVSKTTVDFYVKRFEVDFYNANHENLPKV